LRASVIPLAEIAIPTIEAGLYNAAFESPTRYWKLFLMRYLTTCLLVLAATLSSLSWSVFAAGPGIIAVDTQAIANQGTDSWLSYGRDYNEQRFSELNLINENNISELGLAWSFDTENGRGLEATPVVVDGVIYVTGGWSIVYALDARTGTLIWKYDPQVAKEWGKMACCDVVNRGVAVYEGKVFVGTIDARLVALDAATGKVVWDVKTADTDKFPYTITGAPRAAKDKVFIGNGGAEYGVRGFVSAFDVDTGELVWRFYTVPGNPDEGFENPAMEKAAETWTGQWWKYGGGGTVWDSIVYDMELDQLLIGVGNGSPWNRRVRSPDGGDNLYLSSIVSLNPDTGEYNWHYQETPAETWDYTATQQIMLADMEWQGENKKVIWHAPKNGFFFILDRENGKLLSAEPYAKATWASHYDMETGRPVEIEGSDYAEGPVRVSPSSSGAHGWQPMAYHPGTGLVYIPVMETEYEYRSSLQSNEEFEYKWGHWNLGAELDQGGLNNPLLTQAVIPKMARGVLRAWNPKTQKAEWNVPVGFAWGGGVLATGGNLVFQGNPQKELAAYTADKGDKLWSFEAQTGVIAAPISYTIDGEQYVTVAAGWGGAIALIAGVDIGSKAKNGRILTFKLGGSAVLPPLPEAVEIIQPPARVSEDEQLLENGRVLYVNNCMACHGMDAVGIGAIPDLRRLPRTYYDNFDAIVLEGAMRKLGMVGFKDILSKEDSYAIKAFILEQANQDWELSQQPQWWIDIKRKFYSYVADALAWAME
jgi:quinohemoprotein ethanol dehydrogenase